MDGQVIPRLLVAATGSGAGKTTATLGLIGALRLRGLKVATFKCGPDYLDPGYHRRVTGRPSHNLDGWMMGREAVLATFARGVDGADVAVVEGMMGLFDGTTPTGEEGSTAEIAKWLKAPVILVVDASGMARTVAAVAAGFRHFDPDLNLAGLICNRIGGRGHLDILRAASTEVPVLGGLPLDSGAAFPERHLGLVYADENTVPPALLATWARLAAESIDIDAVMALAGAAPRLDDYAPEPRPPRGPSLQPRCRIGVARDDAFQFYYEDNLRRLEIAGAELVDFAPSRDSRPPEVDGLYFGGGYPEVVAQGLSENGSMIDAVRDFAQSGGPIYAECGGLMYLTNGIRALDGRLWPMVGIIAAQAVMCDRLQALGYVEIETRDVSILGRAGIRVRGHQFRYSTLTPFTDATDRIYSVHPRRSGAPFEEGYRVGNVLASYVHLHWASNPQAAEGLVNSCVRWHKRRA